MSWLFGYEGRINRAKYCIAILLYIVPWLVATAITTRESSGFGPLLMIVVGLLMSMPTAKRLHDLSISGWWQLIGMIPIANIGLGIYLLFWKGFSGSNQYGADPLGVEGKAPQPSPFQKTEYEGDYKNVQNGPPKFAVQPPPSAAVPNMDHITIPAQHSQTRKESANEQEIVNSSSIRVSPASGAGTALEDYAYEVVASELESSTQNKGLWTRVFAECDGDDKAMKVRYIKLRVEQLIAAEQARIEGEALRLASLREQEEQERLSQLGERALALHYIKNGQLDKVLIPADAPQFLQAILERNTNLVQEFLERDVGYLGACGANGNTPLHVAIIEENPQMALLLIEYGAAVNVKNVFGVDLLALAKSKRGMSEVVDAIESIRSEMVESL